MEEPNVTFKKLKKSGQIILVLNINKLYGTVAGCNLKSPNLKAGTYQPESVDSKWQENIAEVREQLQPADFYNRTKDNKHH